MTTNRSAEELDVRLELIAFIRESNAIEGIIREPSRDEIAATASFLSESAPSVLDVEVLVNVYQPNAVLRLLPHLNVRVGNHIAPQGGPRIGTHLAEFLSVLRISDPWKMHLAYETLHPFTDGNGRSGRAIWAWQMLRRPEGLSLGFLHRWYYQTLSASRPMDSGGG